MRKDVRVVGAGNFGLAVAAAMLAAGGPVDMLLGVRRPRPSAPRFVTEADHEAMRRAEEKRQRKAAKLRGA